MGSNSPLALALLFVVVASPARASAEDIVLLPSLGGDASTLSNTTRERTVSAVRSFLESADHRVLGLSDEAMASLADCEGADCAAEARADTEAVWAVRISPFRADDEDAVTEIALTLYGNEGGPYVGRAPVDGDDLQAAVSSAWADAIRRAGAGSGSLPTLYVSGQPPGASVYVDGEYVGVLDYRAPITPGPHDIEIRHPGYRSERRSLQVPEASSHIERVPVVLEREATAGGSGGLSDWAIPTGIGALVAGLAVGILPPAIGAANVGCDDELAGVCTQYTELDVGAAVGWGIAGGILAVAGVVLIIVGATEETAPSVRARISPMGAVLEGSF